MAKEKSLKDLISERIKEARDKKINSKIYYIVASLGKCKTSYDFCSGGGLSSPFTAELRRFSYKKGSLLLEYGYETFDDGSGQTWALIKEKKFFKPKIVYYGRGECILTYIPGKWETKLNEEYEKVDKTLALKGLKAEAPEIETEEMRERKLRERFGL